MSRQDINMVSPDPLERLIAMVLDHEETIKNALNLLEVANNKGVLQMVGYLLSDIDDLAEAGVEMLAKPDTTRMLDNGSKWIKVVKKLDPQALGNMLETVSRIATNWEETTPSIAVHGVWDLVKVLRDPDLSLVLSKLFSTLKVLGGTMREGS